MAGAVAAAGLGAGSAFGAAAAGAAADAAADAGAAAVEALARVGRGAPAACDSPLAREAMTKLTVADVTAPWPDGEDASVGPQYATKDRRSCRRRIRSGSGEHSAEDGNRRGWDRALVVAAVATTVVDAGAELRAAAARGGGCDCGGLRG